MKTTKTMAGMALILVSLLVIGCSATGPTAQTEPIRIGSILILSGEGAAWGIAEKNGIDLAVADINSAGGLLGRKVEAIHEDDKYDPALAITAFRKLVDSDGAKIIIGTTWTRTGLPLVPLADAQEILMISPSLGVKDFNEASRFLFNTWPHDYILSERLADLMYEKGHRRVAVLGAKESWTEDQTKAFAARFKALGGEVPLILEPALTDKDLRAEALKVRSEKDLDAVVLTNGVLDVGPISAKRLREVGVTLPFYSVSLDKNIIKAAGEAYEGLVFPTFLTPSPDFEARYKESFGKELDIGGDSAYDAVMMVSKAIKETGSTDPSTLADYLRPLKSYDGVSGHLVSDGKGGFTKDFRVYRVTDSTAELAS